MPTISKLYYVNPWLQELKTTITSSQQEGERFLITLAETLFYPTGGGQPHDLGTINGEPILDVFERDGQVYHALAQVPLGNEAFCKLDWARRLDHMQQHSGQHLLSAIFYGDLGYKTESFHLGAAYCSIDLATSKLPQEEIQIVEQRVNTVIFDNLAILSYTLTPEEVRTIPARKVPDLEGDLRIVEIKGIDYSPCAGTHLERTSQIGLLKILKAEAYKGMTRVYFLAGQRALADYAKKHATAGILGTILSVPEGELVSRLELELTKGKELEERLQTLQAELMNLRAESVVRTHASPFFLDLPGGSIDEGQQLARAILELAPGVVVINLGERLILVHNLADFLHLGQLIKEHGHPLGGRGGGSATSSQVFFSEPDQLRAFLRILQSKLR